jgi:hypothetical protein
VPIISDNSIRRFLQSALLFCVRDSKQDVSNLDGLLLANLFETELAQKLKVTVAADRTARC